MSEGSTRAVPPVMPAEHTEAQDPSHFAKVLIYRVLVYGALLLWAFICLFPIYWTVTTSFKTATDVTQGHLIPWLDFQPDWRGWRSLGLSPDMFDRTSTVRDEFLLRLVNSVVVSIGASTLAIVIGSLAAYGLSRFEYKWAIWRNKDISFFFLSQLILPCCRSSSGSCAISSIPSRLILSRLLWLMVAPPGGRSSSLFYPSRRQAWWLLLSWPSSCAGTSTFLRLCLRAQMPRRFP
jgi:ABC-type glycerol-3-phosphate transport system permease component